MNQPPSRVRSSSLMSFGSKAGSRSKQPSLNHDNSGNNLSFMGSIHFEPIQGQVFVQLLAHYFWFGLVYLGCCLVQWIPFNNMPGVLIYCLACFITVQVTRLTSFGKKSSSLPIYLSLIPFAFFHILTREAHTSMTVLWYISIMTITLQIGVPNVKKVIMMVSFLFICVYLLCSVFLWQMANSSTFYLLAPLQGNGFNWGEEITCIISLLALALALLLLERFIQNYAQNFFEQENDFKKLKMANVQLTNELKSYKKETKVDLDSPMTKVIQILKNIQGSTADDQNLVDTLDDAIYVLASNQLYQPNIGAQQQGDGEITSWLNTIVNYKQIKIQNQQGSLFSINAPLPASSQNLEPFLETDSAEINNIDSWDFDVFEYAKVTKGRPLLHLGMKLFEKYNFSTTYQIDQQIIRAFFSKVESSYNQNTYHNSIHATDVMQTVHYFMTSQGLGDYLTSDERIACLVAAACHDIDHPGFNNSFLINTNSPLAVKYNDMSVLENYHCSKTFEILLDKNYEIFKNIPIEKMRNIRSIIINCILATDMVSHFEYITKFKNKINGTGFNFEELKDRQLIMEVMVKCGDISNPAKNGEISRKWTDRVMEEFYLQGDEERKRGLPISSFMDRHNSNIPKCQIGFINFIVSPLYEPWNDFINEEGDFKGLDNIKENKAYWEKVLQENEASKQKEQEATNN